MFLLISSTLFAYDPNTPHAHQGVLSPISTAPKAVSVNPAEQAKLKKGEVVLQTVVDDSTGSGRGVAVQYVQASEDLVWDTILNYPRYTDWVGNVVSCSVYKNEKDTTKGLDVLYVEMISSVMWVKFGIYTKNVINKPEQYMHWTLDYSRKSDADDLVGYWRVEQISADPPLTRVDYATQMSVSALPGFIADYLTKDALINGTKWVKREAEKASK